MSRFRPTFFIPLIAFLGLAIIGGLALQGTLSGSRNPNQLPSVLIGKPAPDVPLPLLQEFLRVLRPVFIGNANDTDLLGQMFECGGLGAAGGAP